MANTTSSAATPDVGDLLAAERGEVLEALHRLDQRVVAARHDAARPVFPRVGRGRRAALRPPAAARRRARSSRAGCSSGPVAPQPVKKMRPPRPSVSTRRAPCSGCPVATTRRTRHDVAVDVEERRQAGLRCSARDVAQVSRVRGCEDSVTSAPRWKSRAIFRNASARSVAPGRVEDMGVAVGRCRLTAGCSQVSERRRPQVHRFGDHAPPQRHGILSQTRRCARVPRARTRGRVRAPRPKPHVPAKNKAPRTSDRTPVSRRSRPMSRRVAIRGDR